MSDKQKYIDAGDTYNRNGKRIAKAVAELHPEAEVIITLNRSAIAIINNGDGSCDMISYGDPSSQGMEISPETVKEFATRPPSFTPHLLHIVGNREGPTMWTKGDEEPMVPTAN